MASWIMASMWEWVGNSAPGVATEACNGIQSTHAGYLVQQFMPWGLDKLLGDYITVVAAAIGLYSCVSTQNITDDSFFFGMSPPVYPSPNITGLGDWGAAYTKAKDFVAKMTVEEKASLTFGVGHDNACVGWIPPIPRIDFPGLCLSDAGNGLRVTDFVNAWPSGLHVGATWNKGLATKQGNAMGYEFRTKGVNIALGPVVGPLGRVAVGGRNWEGISNDPYLCGALGAATVEGYNEQGVITSSKHFILNEQETNRNPSSSAGKTIEAVSSNVDDKTMHELYLWPFADLIHAGTGNIMCSYQRANNSYACQNSKLLNGLLKTELGFQGFVVSDWNAQHAGIASALAGMDQAMPASGGFWDNQLVEGVKNGSLPMERLDDMATRIIAAWYHQGQDSGYPIPGIGMPSYLLAPHKVVNAKSPKAKPILLQAAIEGHVLVKNTNHTLPLQSPQLLTIIGYDAAPPVSYNGLSHFYFGNPPATEKSTLYVGGGSGLNNPSYISDPFSAFSQRAYEDNTSLNWDFVTNSGEAGVNPESDACIVFINAYATEGFDRRSLTDEYSDNLILNVANQCKNTIVVIHAAGIRLVDAFVDHPNVKSIILAHLPGQDSGRAIVSLIYGDTNPSGKLPYTLAKKEEDYGALLGPDLPKDEFLLFPQSSFEEGVYIDYRAFYKKGIEPRFEFGFGLSYTEFEYSNLAIGSVSQTSKSAYPTGKIVPGGQEDLWETIVTVSAEVKNTGEREGKEVVQLYVNIPGGPERVLRGFEKVDLKAGERKVVRFGLRRRDLSTWDVREQAWKLEGGVYGVWVGWSSRGLGLNGTVSI